MTRTLLRLPSLLGAAVLAMASVPGGATAAEVAAGEPEVKPFSEPIELRYGGFGTVRYSFRTDIIAPDHTSRLAEGLVLDGTMAPRGDTLEWTYRLSDIGRDETMRERGSLRVRTDAWGQVQTGEVLSDNAPRAGRVSSRADDYFNGADLAFPLCCCPRGPVRMNEEIDVSSSVETMPLPTPPGGSAPSGSAEENTRRSFVAGVAEMDGRRYVVIRHVGRSRVTLRDGAEIAGQMAGTTYLDTLTCLPRISLWVHTEGQVGLPDAPSMVIVHRNEALE